MGNKNVSLLRLLMVTLLLSGCRKSTRGLTAGPYELRYPEGLTLQEVIEVLKSPPLDFEIERVEGGRHICLY